MRRIWISDVTMRSAANCSGHVLSFREKIELSKLLDKLGASVIETPPIVNKKTDSLLIKSLASAIRESVLAVPVSITDPESVGAAWNAVSGAKFPRLQVPVPVSTVQMEYICSRKPAAVLEMLANTISECKKLGCEVEFVAEDAGRSEADFLSKAINAASAAGADIVTICDTAGTMLPDEFRDSVKKIRNELPGNVRLGVSCSNAMYMADSNAMAAVQAGADEVKTISSGDGITALDKLVRIIQQRGEDADAFTTVRVTELRRAMDQIHRICQTNRSKNSPFDNGVRSDSQETILSVHDDMQAVNAAARNIGYDLSEEDAVKVYEAFQNIASRKEQVGSRELDAIVASAAMQVPPTYQLESYVINSGNIITATAHVKLKKEDQILEGICIGDGPIDASFLAVEQIIGCHYELDDFQIQAVTEGREAMGETVVRLRSGGKLYSGRGISTDIIGSSIRAYINAVNKIVYEEAEA